MIRRYVQLALIITISVQYVASLQCFTCTNARTESECKLKGKIRKCSSNADSCMVERRFGSLRNNVHITKNCKQRMACEAASKQNPWLGREQKLNTVCYSCCQDDKCNDENMNLHLQKKANEEEEEEYNPRSWQRSLLAQDDPLGLKLFDFPMIPTCPQFEGIENGRSVCSLRNEIGSSCRFTCNKSYFLRGSRTIYCRREGEWSSPPPTCGPFSCQPEPFNMKNGYSYCRSAGPSRTVCRFGCRWTHRLQGAPLSTCMINLENPDESYWSRPLPTCTTKYPSCVQPKKSAGMSYKCTKGVMSGTICTFACDAGYEMEGKAKIACVDNKDDTSKWSADIPTCKEKLKCDTTLPAALHRDCTQGSYVDSVCEFTCKDEQLALIGNEMVTCIKTADGKPKWDGEAPTCEKRSQCTPLKTTRDFAVLSCTSRNNVGSNCEFSCPTNHVLLGDESITCDEDDSGNAVWSGSVPRCIGKCPILDKDIYGTVTCSKSIMEGSKCTYSCSYGKALIGLQTRTCLQRRNGSYMWTGRAPKCEEHTKCTFPKITEALQVSCSSRDLYPGARCRFSCKKGFALIGQDTAACKSWSHRYARWDRIRPICRGICPNFGDLENGNARCNQESFIGSSCTFTCDEHYELIGPEQLKCVQGNTTGLNIWDDAKPTCRSRLRCPPLPENSRTMFTCNDDLYSGSTCQFSCNQQYTLYGSQSITCLAKDSTTAVWSGAIPQCRGQCQNLPEIVNGSISCSDQDWKDSICKFKCDANYRLKGPSSTTCRQDYHTKAFMWSNLAPTCIELAKCSTLKSKNAMTVDCSNVDPYIGTVCEFACAETYQLIGDEQIRCIISQNHVTRWNTYQGYCRGKCDDVGTIENGKVRCGSSSYANSNCVFSCDEHYELKGSNKMTCALDSNGLYKWNNEVPTCQLRKRCEAFTAVDGLRSVCSDKHYLGSSCSFSCPANSALIGNRTTTCVTSNDNSTRWSETIPICKAMCMDLGKLEHGSTFCTDNLMSDSMCTFKCDDNYDLIGPSAISCSEGTNGKAKWTSTIPICREHPQCPAPTTTEGLNISCSDEQLYPGSKCNFKCDDSYKLFGEDALVCSRTSEQKAAWSETQPRCEGACTLLTSIDNGRIDCSRAELDGSTCAVTCDEHHQLIGVQSVTCSKSGEGAYAWSDELPICKLRPQCTAIPIDSVGEMTVACNDSFYTGSTCQFSCPSGYALIGDENISCMGDDGSRTFWSGTVSYCREICPGMENVENGEMSCSDGTYANSTCAFACDDASYQLIGDAQTICTRQMDGKYDWNNEIPTCQKRLRCPELSGITDIVHSCADGDYVGSVCNFQCDKYQLRIGVEQVSCQEENGVAVLSDPLPFCRGICSEQSAPTNGAMKCTDESFVDSQCNFTCEENFDMNGISTINCEKNNSSDESTWSDQAPICTRTPECLSLPTTTEATIECSNGIYADSSCRFSCPSNFIMIGTEVIHCERDGAGNATWDIQPPTCQENCEAMKPVTNGTVTCTEGNLQGSICSFVCDDKHDLIGDVESVCTDTNGIVEWTSVAPTCQRYHECGSVQLTPGLSVNCDREIRVGSRCRFSCGDGFIMSGSDEAECEHNDDSSPAWSARQPNCLPVCEDFGAFGNGMTRCSNDRISGSTCNFACREGFELIGASQVSCDLEEKTFTATWTDKIPVCEEIKKCAEIGVTADLPEFLCSDDNLLGSVCFFICPLDQQLVGSEEVFCKGGNDGNVGWNATWPHCVDACEKATPIENGDMMCNSENHIGSFCTFNCHPGYQLFGSPFVSCDKTLHGNLWAPQFPVCLPTCDLIEVVANGDFECTRDNTVGSTCTFSCADQYDMVGSDETRCILSSDEKTAMWSQEPPTCAETCPRVFNTKHKLCTDGYFLDSICVFDCNEGDVPIISICNRTDEGVLEWSRQPPKCISKCRKIPEPENGVMECDDEENIGSTCSFHCKPGFSLSGRTQSICMQNSLGESSWSSMAPMCLPMCEPFPQLPGQRTSCTRGREVNSICKLTCDPGYKIANIRKSFSICSFKTAASGAAWTPFSGCIKL